MIKSNNTCIVTTCTIAYMSRKELASQMQPRDTNHDYNRVDSNKRNSEISI